MKLHPKVFMIQRTLETSGNEFEEADEFSEKICPESLEEGDHKEISSRG
jgi:hypothetical protein